LRRVPPQRLGLQGAAELRHLTAKERALARFGGQEQVRDLEGGRLLRARQGGVATRSSVSAMRSARWAWRLYRRARTRARFASSSASSSPSVRAISEARRASV